MARRFAKVSEEEIVAINEAAFFYPSDLVNSKTTILLKVDFHCRTTFTCIRTQTPTGPTCANQNRDDV